MTPDAPSPCDHIEQVKVVSNTQRDREFRRSFEQTRRRLLTMMDVTLAILAKDPNYHSFTMDGHSIMIDDYLEMRPEKRPLVEKLIRSGRLVIGPCSRCRSNSASGANRWCASCCVGAGRSGSMAETRHRSLGARLVGPNRPASPDSARFRPRQDHVL